ncbi:uncharacterized protein LOC131014869 isoform X2 [Salvia miltiorrhiza]|uniref:uncharacterized protein LOC131014869 isoform X2 n=2 Tax=Salvia miltiorrhiza TaxID=226208 RepID=UPI0025AC7402|nr:uncharacterized protein LOC131014869 isoform X2 [Salvia miltiorrhiza]
MAGKPGDNLHRLVAYDWTNKDCKELGIHNYGFPIKKHRMECFEINVFCYVESSVALPHGEPIVGSGFLNHLPVVDELDDNYCDCDCHDDDSTEDDSECKCCRGYTDAYKIDIEDFAVNGFRILSDTEEVGPDISKKQLALKPTAGNPDAQGGKKKKKKKKKKKTPDAQGNISRHDQEGELNICSNAQGVDMFPMINRLFVGSIPVLAFSIIQLDPESSDHHQYKKQGGLNFAHHLTKTEAA